MAHALPLLLLAEMLAGEGSIWLQIVPVALPEAEGSFHCCLAAGEEIYERFLQSRDVCTHSILLHPVRLVPAVLSLLQEQEAKSLSAAQVKLCSDSWPREPNITRHGIPSRPL